LVEAVGQRLETLSKASKMRPHEESAVLIRKRCGRTKNLLIRKSRQGRLHTWTWRGKKRGDKGEEREYFHVLLSFLVLRGRFSFCKVGLPVPVSRFPSFPVESVLPV
jgi:hypothetical protein